MLHILGGIMAPLRCAIIPPKMQKHNYYFIIVFYLSLAGFSIRMLDGFSLDINIYDDNANIWSFDC